MPRLLLCFSLALGTAAIVPSASAQTAATGSQRPPAAAPQAGASNAPRATYRDRTGGVQQRTQADGSTQQVPRPAAAPMQVSPAMEAVLAKWEAMSSRVSTLNGNHMRFVFDTVAGVERRGAGKFWFASPDKGRLDLKPVEIDKKAVGQWKMPDGTPFRIVSDQPMMWLCNGSDVFQVEPEQKGYYRTEIPVQLQGENIIQSPLPFLFGMKAAEVKARYRLQFGKRHTYDPNTKGTGQKVHLVAFPLRRSDATNWSQADIELDGVYFLPLSITLRDPAGTQVTSYVFDRKSLKANQKSWLQLGDPFKPNLSRYRLLGESTAQTQSAGRGTQSPQ